MTACTGVLDVNGDGYGDTPVGVPGEDVGSAVDAGAVSVLLGGPSGKPYGAGILQLTEADLGQEAEAGDAFGSAIAVADFDRDGCLDLAVGAPGKDEGAGRVSLTSMRPGTALPASTEWLSQSGPRTDDVPEPGDAFGASLAAMYDHDGKYTMLWVGAPGEDVGTAVDAGMVARYGDEEYVHDPISDHVLTRYQGVSQTDGTPETGDRFGATLTAGVDWAVVGAPGEDVGSVVDAGMVLGFEQDLRGKAVTQNSRRIPGTAEAGDQFGAALAVTWDCDSDAGTVVVGVPGEDLGKVSNAGLVTVLGGPHGGIGSYAITQNSKGVPGVAEAGDRFGAAVTGDWSGFAAGSPGEDLGGVHNAGSVTDVWLACQDGETGVPIDALSFAQSTPHVAGLDEAEDSFGSTLMATYWNDSWGDLQSAVLVGTPGEDVGSVVDAGTVTVLHYVRKTARLTAKKSVALNEGSSGASESVEQGDGFGSVL